MKEKDDVPLISLEGYAETHEELERMVKNCQRELEEMRKELGFSCKGYIKGVRNNE